MNTKVNLIILFLLSVATIGAVSGWEYLVKYSTIRSFGEEYAWAFPIQNNL